jgi:hypothetical protein
VGDCQRASGNAAQRDGIPLQSGSLQGITSAGHLALDPASPNRVMLAAIFDFLNGDVDDLAVGGHAPLPLDWLVPESKLIIEVDEQQHFTSERLRTLEAYPQDAEVCFSVDEYKGLCRALRGGTDLYRADKPARGFRRHGGRRAQRAYFDAVKDLAAPDMGWLVFRVPAGHQDGARAYREIRVALRDWLGLHNAVDGNQLPRTQRS